MAMRIGAVLSTLLVMVTWVVSPAWPAELVPHRAIYRITLGSSTPGSGVVGTEGAMLYRFDDGCDGWTVENKTYVRYHRDQAESIETSWTYVTWESKDGLAYRFRVKNDRNGETFQRFQGTASLGGSGGGRPGALLEAPGHRNPPPRRSAFPDQAFGPTPGRRARRDRALHQGRVRRLVDRQSYGDQRRHNSAAGDRPQGGRGRHRIEGNPGVERSPGLLRFCRQGRPCRNSRSTSATARTASPIDYGRILATLSWI